MEGRTARPVKKNSRRRQGRYLLVWGGCDSDNCAQAWRFSSYFRSIETMPNTTILERLTFPAGEKIFAEGEQGDRAYIVESGAVEVYGTKDGQKVVYGTIGKGGIFGEMALIDDKPRMATARTAQPSTIIVISRNMFQEKLAHTDPFIRGLLKIFAGNIRAMSAKTGVAPAAPVPAQTAEAAADTPAH
jgi:CRP/FNR family cyclic AMP-dependent transcriptional regulator